MMAMADLMGGQSLPMREREVYKCSICGRPMHNNRQRTCSDIKCWLELRKKDGV